MRLPYRQNHMLEILIGKHGRTEPLPAKAGRFGELLKQPKGSAPQLLLFILLFSNFKVVRVTSLLQILVLDILFDYFIRHVSATCHKISSRP